MIPRRGGSADYRREVSRLPLGRGQYPARRLLGRRPRLDE